MHYSDDSIDTQDRRESKELAGLGGDSFPFETGVLPEDFSQRLTRLKEASGLTWSGLSRTLGVDPKQMYRWRKGTEPCGGAMLSLCRFARRMPGGIQILMGDGP